MGVVVGLAIVGEALFAGSLEAVDALLADVFSSSVVFVVGGDVADSLVQAHGVVVVADTSEFAFEELRVVDLFEVRPLAFDVPEQRLDPGLIGRGVRPAVVRDYSRGHATTVRFRAVVGQRLWTA